MLITVSPCATVTIVTVGSADAVTVIAEVIAAIISTVSSRLINLFFILFSPDIFASCCL